GAGGAGGGAPPQGGLKSAPPRRPPPPPPLSAAWVRAATFRRLLPRDTIAERPRIHHPRTEGMTMAVAKSKLIPTVAFAVGLLGAGAAYHVLAADPQQPGAQPAATPASDPFKLL